MLDARRLHLLHQLATHGTVAAAAEAMHLSGPAVSQQLAALEREAKVPLLEKHGRRLRLTPAGQLLAAHAEVIAGDLAAAEAELESLRGGERGTVRIAAFPSAARVLLPPVWRRLADEGPTLQLIEHEPDGAIRALRERAAEVAVVYRPVASSTRWSRIRCCWPYRPRATTWVRTNRPGWPRSPATVGSRPDQKRRVTR